MLLREPDANTGPQLTAMMATLNGNPPLHQQRPWTDVSINKDVNTNSLSGVGYIRDGRHHQLLSSANSGDVDASNNRIGYDDACYAATEQRETTTKLEPFNKGDFSPDEGLFDYEDDDDRSCSSAEEDTSASSSSSSTSGKSLEHSAISDGDPPPIIPRGIHNPNYPGFQHLAFALHDDYRHHHHHLHDCHQLDTPTTFDDACELEQDVAVIEREPKEDEKGEKDLKDLGKAQQDEDDVINNNRASEDDRVTEEQEDKRSPDVGPEPEPSNDSDSDYLVELRRDIYESLERPLASALAGLAHVVEHVIRRTVEQHDVPGADVWRCITDDEETTRRLRQLIGLEDSQTEDPKAKSDAWNIVDIIKTTMDDAYMSSAAEDLDLDNNKDVDAAMESQKTSNKAVEAQGEFDVYNIETAMPLIDLDAIESHLRAAREEERRRRNDREEIRRRLAMGVEHDDFYSLGDRPGRKPSLQSRLQSGMNLQICFMNETASDTESPSDVELTQTRHNQNTSAQPTIKRKSSQNNMEKKPAKAATNPTKAGANPAKALTRPSYLPLKDTTKMASLGVFSDDAAKLDFFECQARLQTEARMALAQAKEIARMQMEAERQKQDKSPITEMLRSSLRKAGVDLLGDRRRVSRQMLTDINVAQLQVIVNELHTQIERLNDSLVELLIARDELHMGQDSMLVDIEDLTRHLGAKDLPCKTQEVAQCKNPQESEKHCKSQSRASSIQFHMKK